ncbi:hypothetical protein H257_07522 [Aphanomyces astaci]|uniref:Uncharacterized protein n=1 Tax=Aphanomyces astaci TaxID=112090 RepID=W4GG51_APHAT|nr:hypothetical protein H257_07522 [Aphanomyces astaci]ETV78662.1 hypothetical protein H257_07522 [Aphanomyces astaci]|eukprot:XP_009831381.1 hypothetical protein H257_07522 [Aphanomyces astaci]
MLLEDIEGDLILDAVDKVLQRREHFREKQRSHRRRQRDEFLWLQTQAAGLEALATRLRHIACSNNRPKHDDGLL